MEERILVHKPDSQFPLGIYTGDTILYHLCLSKEVHEGVVCGKKLWAAEDGRNESSYPGKLDNGNLHNIPYLLKEPWGLFPRSAWIVSAHDIEVHTPSVPMTEEGQLLMF